MGTQKKMRAVARAVLAAAIALAGCVAGCSSKSSSGVQTRVSPNAKPLADETAKHATIKPTSLIFKKQGNESLANVQAGQVLVSGYEDGFIRRVTGVTDDGANLTIATEDAKLTDVVEEGETSATIDLSTLLPASQTPPGIHVQGVHQATFDVDLSGKSIASHGVTVRITQGSLHFVPQFDVGITVKDGVSAHAIASGTISADLHVEASASKMVASRFTKRLWISKAFRVSLPPIGGVPISATARLAIDASFDVNASGQVTVSFGAAATASASFGVRYDAGGWREEGDISASWMPDTPSVWSNAEIHATAFVTGELQLGIFGGLDLRIVKLGGGGNVSTAFEPYLRFDYASSASPPWTLTGGFRGHYSASLDVLGANIPAVEPAKDLFDRARQIAPPAAGENVVSSAPSCSDSIQDGDESDVDCGGSCSPCDDGKGCAVATDCKGGSCATSGLCAPATCAASPFCKRDGSQCPLACAGKACSADSDCASGACDALERVCNAPPYCSDGVQNEDETATDCGGSCAPLRGCAVGDACIVDADCANGACVSGACADVPRNCIDGSLDGDETDVDCGGSCAPALECDDGKACAAGVDCKSAICNGGLCGTGQTCDACITSATGASGGCASEASSCQNDADCAAFTTCTGQTPCDQQCVATCVSQHQSGASEFLRLQQCVCTTACYTPCASTCGN
jgi:hypothetical protein